MLAGTNRHFQLGVGVRDTAKASERTRRLSRGVEESYGSGRNAVRARQMGGSPKAKTQRPESRRPRQGQEHVVSLDCRVDSVKQKRRQIRLAREFRTKSQKILMSYHTKALGLHSVSERETDFFLSSNVT